MPGPGASYCLCDCPRFDALRVRAPTRALLHSDIIGSERAVFGRARAKVKRQNRSCRAQCETSSMTAPAQQIESPYAWGRLIASLGLMTLCGVGMYAAAVALPAIQSESGVTRWQASLPS